MSKMSCVCLSFSRHLRPCLYAPPDLVFRHLEIYHTFKTMTDFIVPQPEVSALIKDLDLQLVHIYDDNNAEIKQNKQD